MTHCDAIIYCNGIELLGHTTSSLNFIRMSDGRGGKISLAQTDYSELENVVYFTSKCNSLVEILDEHLKERDRQVFQKVKERVCTELKKQMEIAIDRYNQELDESTASAQGMEVDQRMNAGEAMIK